MATEARSLEASSIDIGIDIYVQRTSKRVSFKLRFHEMPALKKENGAVHIPQKNNDREGQGYVTVESYHFSDIDDSYIAMALNS